MTGHWADQPLLAIDTETTGVDPFSARIVEVATATIDPTGTVIDSWSTIVDPGVRIPDEAAAIHGINTDRARAEGIAPGKALTELAARIWEHVDTFQMGAPLAMYNARFDWTLIMAEAARRGVDVPVFAPVVDPLLLDRMCDRYRKGGRKLQVVAGHYGVVLSDDDAHGALADAVAAGRVMRRIVERFPQLRDLNLNGIWLHQAHGHEQDRQRLVDWKRRNSDPEFDAPAGWPLPVEPERRR